MNLRNLRVGMNFSESPLPPVPLVGLELPTTRNWRTAFYLSAQPKDAYFQASLRPQIIFLNSSRFRVGAYSEIGFGYFMHGVRGREYPGGSQGILGVGLEACLRVQQHGVCLSAGYAAAFTERSIFTRSLEQPIQGWDNRNLLSIGLTLAFGI